MPKFTVTRPEVHISYVRIEAETKEEALHLVRSEGAGDEVDCEYSHTVDDVTSWDVLEDEDEDEYYKGMKEAIEGDGW